MESGSPIVPGTSGRRGATRWARLAVLVGLILVATLALLLSRLPPGLTRGVWLSAAGPSAEAPEQLVLVFEDTRGLVSGTVHQLRAGKQVLQWGFAGTRPGSDSLEISWGNDVTFRGAADLRQGTLSGRILMPDGNSHNVLFKRTTAEEVPGFLAQPELPYQLRPPPTGSGWEIAAPAEVGIDPRHLERTIQALTRGDAGLLHSLVLTRYGKLVAEEYFHGYSRQDLHETQSATKSVVSLLIGIALDQGFVESLDEPVLDYFPEYADGATPGWEQVTLRHLLTMTAGVDWSPREVFAAHGAGPPLFRKVLSRQVIHAPGSKWLYNGADLNLLAGVIFQATGMQADEFAARSLLEPLGITTWDWELGKTDGYPSLAGTLALRPLDMAKIGQLVLDEGRWQGEQLVSKEWIAESTATTSASRKEGQRHGYLWWQTNAPLDSGHSTVILASGWGSQFIHVVPDLYSVAATTGGNHFNNKNYAIGEVLVRRLLPGVEP